MVADRFLGDHHVCGDRGVGAAFGHQAQYVSLSWSEGGQGVPSAQELCDDLRVHDGAAGGDLADGVDELLYVADAVFQEVANRTCGVGPCPGRTGRGAAAASSILSARASSSAREGKAKST